MIVPKFVGKAEAQASRPLIGRRVGVIYNESADIPEELDFPVEMGVTAQRYKLNLLGLAQSISQILRSRKTSDRADTMSLILQVYGTRMPDPKESIYDYDLGSSSRVSLKASDQSVRTILTESVNLNNYKHLMWISSFNSGEKSILYSLWAQLVHNISTIIRNLLARATKQHCASRRILAGGIRMAGLCYFRRRRLTLIRGTVTDLTPEVGHIKSVVPSGC